MAKIEDYLKQILEARYGEDVRGSIHDSIEMISKIAGIKFGTDVTSASSPTGSYEIGTFYLNTSTFDLWCMASVNSWVLAGNIKGVNGNNGVGISKIEKTSMSGKVDTYTITYTDSSTSTFNVTNGKDGNKIIGVTEISHVGLVHTYQINLDDSTSYTFTVSDGQSGSGSGDMTKAVYDKSDNGMVDVAEELFDSTNNKKAITSVLANLTDDGGKLAYKGTAVGGDVDIDDITIKKDASNGKIKVADSITGKLVNLDSNGKIDYSNVNNAPSVSDTYSATSSDAMSGKAVASAISGKADSSALDSWFSQTQQATSTGEQTIVFSGIDTTKAYELFFDTSDGSQVGLKSSALSGTTLTYVVDIPTTTAVPVNFKLREIQ